MLKNRTIFHRGFSDLILKLVKVDSLILACLEY